MNNIGVSEISLLILGLIVLFGSEKIIGLARRLGETTKELSKAKEAYNQAITEGVSSVDSPKVIIEEKGVDKKTSKKSKKSSIAS